MRKILIAAAALFVGFWFLPTSKVQGSIITKAVYADWSVMERETTRTGWGNPLKYYTDFRETARAKSGLREAFEGRLKWLGIADEIRIYLPCYETNGGSVVCRRLF